MSDWPTLAILVVTYNRKEILQETVGRLFDNLHYNGDRIMIVADDGSNDGTQEWVQDASTHAHLVQSDRLGLGGNENSGLQFAFGLTPFVLQIQDDMHLMSDLDVSQHVAWLRDNDKAGMIRLQGILGHYWTCSMLPSTPEMPLQGYYFRVHWDCQEIYIAGDHVHLKHKRFHDFFGYYPEKLRSDNTEERWCVDTKHAAEDAEKLGRGKLIPQVYIPVGVDTENIWYHAGHERWRDVGL